MTSASQILAAIANAEAITGMKRGTAGGMFIPTRSPVTQAISRDEPAATAT